MPKYFKIYIMSKIWYAIGDFFEYIFDYMPAIGDKINYFFVAVIVTFLVVWTSKMIKHKKNGEEHTSS